MKLHISSATVQSYENKEGSMDLFFNPIIIFEDVTGDQIEQINDVLISIQSEEIGDHYFDISSIQRPSLKDEMPICLEFRLVKRDVKFLKENYICKLKFEAVFEEDRVEYETFGIVKTKFSKGLV